METNAFIFLVLSIILIFASAIDFYKQRIPNLLTFPTIIVAIIYHGYLNGFQGLSFSLIGFLIGLATLILPYMMGGMGAGDVKLMGAVGALLGAKAVFLAFLLTAVFGGIYAIVIILLNQNFSKGVFKNFFHTILAFLLTKKYSPIGNKNDKPKLCYGIAIALGTFTYMGLSIVGYDFSI